MKKLHIIFSITIALTILLTTVYTVTAAPPGATVPAPTAAPPLPSPSTGGGSTTGGSTSSSGSSFSPPIFKQYTMPLNSSDGSTIGSFEGKDFNSVFVHAVKNATTGNISYELSMEGELSFKPADDCWLDFNFIEPGSSGLPPGMDNALVFGAVNVTRKPNDWSYKSGSPKYMLKITGYSGDIASGDDYFLVRSDGSSFLMQKAVVDVSGNQLSIRFTTQDTGIFSLMKAVTPTPTHAPTPSLLPTPTPTSMPENSMWGYPIFIAVLICGIIIGATALFFFTRNK